jgi:hypothetical protein
MQGVCIQGSDELSGQEMLGDPLQVHILISFSNHCPATVKLSMALTAISNVWTPQRRDCADISFVDCNLDYGDGHAVGSEK